MESYITYLTSATGGSAAVRILPPATEETTPSHFICLVDVSDSMSDGDKLNNVKHCLRLLLQILSPRDAFSLITFGEESTIVLKEVSVKGAGIELIRKKIEELETDGCTNLSAGLASVREVLGSAAIPTQPQRKQGLMLLTDGHANRGHSKPGTLREILRRILEFSPGLTCNFLAYGTDHNAELLQGMAADTLGSYTIIQDLEGAALGIGDSLGSILSCSAQNVELLVPAGTKVPAGSPYSVKDGKIILGDLYSGTSTVILLDLPTTETEYSHSIALKGVLMPSLEPFHTNIPNRTLNTEFDREVELTRLRYKCSELFREVRTNPRPQLRAEIDALAAALTDTRINRDDVTDMLNSEIESLRIALDAALRGRTPARLQSLLAQHEAYTALGRGAAIPIVLEPEPEPSLHRGFLFGSQGQADEDPSAQPPRSSYFLSPTSSVARQRVARQMQHLSQMEGHSQ